MRPLQQIFQQLPQKFTRKDVDRLMKRHHRTIPVEEIIYRYKAQGFIRNTTHNNFIKII